MSARSNPLAEIERFFERMSQQFEDATRSWEASEPSEWGAGTESMAIDLVEHDEKFVAMIDLPGFDRDQIEVRVTDSTLRIDATREETVEETDTEFIHRERHHASVRRSIRLPQPVATDDVEAHLDNGVLTVTLPKVEAETARDIEIE